MEHAPQYHIREDEDAEHTEEEGRNQASIEYAGNERLYRESQHEEDQSDFRQLKRDCIQQCALFRIPIRRNRRAPGPFRFRIHVLL